jgi:hypothetical protein
MSAFDAIGGTPVNPARTSLNVIALTANLTLDWPWVQQDTADVVAYINRVTPDAAGRTITMPAANEAPAGQDQLFQNLGADSFEVLDAAAGSIATVPAGRAVYVYIVDNSTVAGTWQTFTFGAGSSQADAASLAGKGLIALNSVLNQDYPVSLLVADQTITPANRATMFVVDPSVGSGTLTFDSIATLTNGFFILFNNQGSGAWTMAPDGTEEIDGQLSIDINPGESCEIHVGAAGLYTVGRGRNVEFSFTQLNLDVSGNTDVTLTTAQAGNFVQRYFGALTGNIAVIVPDAVSVWDLVNDTTGAFQLTVKTAAGTGLVIGQGQSVIARSDGTDVFDADTETPTPASQQFADGSAGAPSITFVAQANLGAYRKASNTMGFTANGNEVWEFDTTGINVVAGDLKKGGLDISAWAMIYG